MVTAKGLNLFSILAKISDVYRDWFQEKQAKYLYLGLFVSSLSINILSLAFPIFVLQTYDRIIPNESMHTFTILIIATIVAIILETILRILRIIISSWADVRFEFSHSYDAFKKIIYAPILDSEKDEPGTQLARLNSINKLKNFVTGEGLIVLIDLPFIALYLFFIAHIGGVLVIVPIMMLAAYVWRSIVKGRALKEKLQSKSEAEDRRANFLIETLGNIHTAKSMCMEKLLQRRYERLQKQLAVLHYDIGIRAANTSRFTLLASQYTVIFLMIMGSLLVIDGQLSIGGLIACTLLTGRCLQPASKATKLWNRTQGIIIARAQMRELDTLKAEINDKKELCNVIDGNIQFESLCYNFDAKNVNQINLAINAGDMIAIQGPSSQGKTTLLLSILGIVQPKSGQVLIDNINIKDYNTINLRSQISYIPENATLLEGSVLDNLTNFNAEYLGEEVYQLTEKLKIDKIIKSLPEGYATQVGRKTSEILPAGVIQRISLCAGLIKKPKILLFDEANKGVDFEADSVITALLREMKGTCTIIMVSHRPSLVRLADKTYHLNNGEIKCL